jgi:ATP-binding cassette subfamily B protein
MSETTTDPEAPTRSNPLGRMVRGYRRSHATARATLFWALLRRQRRWLKWLFVMLVLQVAFQLIAAELLVNMVNNAISAQAQAIPPYVVRLAIFAAIAYGFSFCSLVIVQRLAYQIEFDLRTWLYTRIQSAELRRLDQVASGQMVMRSMTDLQLLVQLLTVFPTLVGVAPIIFALWLFMLFLSWPLALISAVGLPFNIWLVWRFRKRLWGLSWAELNERGEVMGAIGEPVKGIRVVKAFGREEHEEERVQRVAGRTYRFAMTRVRLIARYSLWIRMIPFLVQGVVLLVGARLLSDGSLSLGAFLLAFQLGSAFTQLSTQFDQIASGWQYLRTAQIRLAEVLALGTRPITEGHRLPPSSSGLELRGVGVRVVGRTVLDGFDLSVLPGELVVVTGGPGSGKSTLAGVASGLIIPWEGTVLLDGADIGTLEPNEYRRAVRMVSEEPLLLAATLQENLTLGAPPDTPEELVLGALEAAGALDIFEGLPGGLDGVIGDRGLTLSGGQRQRLALARALVARPRLLVLDDALSAINPSLEIEILRRLRAFLPGAAILCVTRRGGPVRMADRVVELRAAEVGVAPSGADESAPLATAAPDPRLSDIVGSLKLTDETPGVSDHQVADDRQITFRRVARPFRWLIAAAAVVVLVQTAAQLSPQVLFGATTNASSSGTHSGLGLIGLLLLGLGVVYGVTSFGSQILAQRFTQGLIYFLRRKIFRRLSQLGIDYYDREMPGKVAARVVNDLDNMLNFLQGYGFILLAGIAQFVVGLSVIVVLAPHTLPVVLGMVALMVAVTAVELVVGTRALGWARHNLGSVMAKFDEDFVARHEIRTLGALRTQTDKFVVSSWGLRRARWWVAVVNSGYSTVMAYLGFMTGVFVLWRAGDQVLAGTLSIGTALSLQLIASAATQPIQIIAPYYSQLLDVRVSWGRLKEPFAAPILPVKATTPRPCPPLTGDVVFDGVGFSYPHTEKTVLHDVSFRIVPHGVTALVGYTGAGKSSVAKILARTYDPDAGRVVVDGVNLRELDLDAYTAHLGVVPQDDFLFKGTIGTNIGYGRLGATGEEIEEAARAVGAHELLTALTGGYGHPVEEEGRNLTNAQRQLVALARAWLARPDILVLDEATSSLDPDLEDRVLAAVRELGCTTLMITHREAAVHRADHVIVIEAGRVVQAGTLDEVIGSRGAYDLLWEVDEEHAYGTPVRPERPPATPSPQALATISLDDDR